jgi:hypothetical protein
MKRRILNYHFPATHDSFTTLSSIDAPESISDFDAFIFDPTSLGNQSLTAFERRQTELFDLVHKKGGLILSILRPNMVVNASGRSLYAYALLERVAPAIMEMFYNSVQAGAGSQVAPVLSARGPSLAYFQALRGCLAFVAHLSITESQVKERSGTILAVDSVGYPIAVEFRVAEGLLCFVPIPHNVTGDRTGAAIVKTVAQHFNKPTGLDAPSWASEMSVPGASLYDERIAELGKQRERLSLEISGLEDKRDELRKYLRLLFGYGKAVLEPVVRAAFRLSGFAVPEPEDYEGEWDVELLETKSGRTAIGEVEGSEDVIDVDKYRQLLDYVEAEALEGRDHKGILIGNGFRLTAPEAPERQQQFSPHVLRGAARNQFCLLPTTELFKAVCALLENPEDEGLKVKIRDSVLTTVGIWTFAQ